MSDTRHVIENPDSPSPRREDRAEDLAEWDEAQARRTAQEAGIELTDAHWEVVHFLRERYLREAPPQSGREIGDLLEERFAAQGGRRYLRRLFPEGPVRQGLQIAGLPVPAYTEDEGFGTSR